MKRSYESEESGESDKIQEIKKQFVLCNNSENDEISETDNNSVNDVNSLEIDDDFFDSSLNDSISYSDDIDLELEDISYNERQIIRVSLAAILRSNIYDWNVENDEKSMILREEGYITNRYSQQKQYAVAICLKYSTEITYCSISYIIGTSEIKKMLISWESSNNGSRTITIRKTDVENYCLFFNREIPIIIKIFVEDIPEHYWCYFTDARYHINRILI